MIEHRLFETIILFSVISLAISYFALYLTMKYSNLFYTLSESNNKSSVYHKPLFRGLGVLYLLPLIPVMLLTKDAFTFKEILLLFFSTMLGYYDDKKGLGQSLKLILLFIIYMSIFSFDMIFRLDDLFLFFIKISFFILFVLFFNQIDGINGLSVSSFLVCITSIFIMSSFTNMNIPTFVSVIVTMLVYLNFNMRLKTVLQGDAGSYFIGAFILIIVCRSYEGVNIFLSLFLVMPLLIDVSLTTISRIIYGKKVFEGHRDNIYQQFTFYTQKPNKVTFCIVAIQLVISLILMFLNYFFSLYLSIIIGFLFTLVCGLLWYKFHKKFDVKNI